MKQKIKAYRALILAVLSITVLAVVFSIHKPKAASKAEPIVLNEFEPAVSGSQIQVPLVNLSAALAPSKPDAKSIRVPILMYHHVGYLEQNHDALAVDLTVSPEDFEAEVSYFKNAGYHSVTLAQVYDSLENNTPLPSKPIVFTFDDGYKDVFTYAVPILEKNNYTGTFAIATELLGRPTYAIWDDVIAVQKQGMEIVSHTENHLDLTNHIYSDADLKREIVDSKQVLESRLGVPIDFFVYPYGKVNDRAFSVVEAAGYKMALTTAFGTYVKADSLLITPRVRVHGGPDSFTKLKAIFSPKPNNAAVKSNP